MLDRNKTIAISALNGATLEKVASDFDVTRERVRQIVAKMLRIACTKFLGHSSSYTKGYPAGITLQAIRKNATYYTDAIAKVQTADYYKDPYGPFFGPTHPRT
jgi:hypothetical protein